jgi:hypothetical protein
MVSTYNEGYYRLYLLSRDNYLLFLKMHTRCDTKSGVIPRFK